MSTDPPLVSVIIPVYNCERYLADAIESVLAQDYHSIEVILVDDGSTDGSAAVAKRFLPKVRYTYQPQSGAAAARNAGVKLAQGSYLAFLDSDDIWMTDKLARQMAVFDDDPNLDIVFGHVLQFKTPGLNASAMGKSGSGEETLPGYVPGTMVIKRESFLQVGPFDTNWRVGEFIDWYSKAIDQGLKSRILTGVLMKRRIHTSNLGIRERNQQSEYVRILKASLDRRRKLRSPR